jgi:flavodoxin
MSSLVVYDSKFGNTEALAHAIADELHTQAVPATEPLVLDGVDLLVVGGPTQVHSVSKRLAQLLDGLPPHALEGVAVAAFDTRFRRSPLLTGTAARGIAKKLVRRGGRLAVEPESFFVAETEGPLEPSELERAVEWARALSPVAPRPAARAAP